MESPVVDPQSGQELNTFLQCDSYGEASSGKTNVLEGIGTYTLKKTISVPILDQVGMVLFSPLLFESELNQIVDTIHSNLSSSSSKDDFAVNLNQATIRIQIPLGSDQSKSDFQLKDLITAPSIRVARILPEMVCNLSKIHPNFNLNRLLTKSITGCPIEFGPNEDSILSSGKEQKVSNRPIWIEIPIGSGIETGTYSVIEVEPQLDSKSDELILIGEAKNKTENKIHVTSQRESWLLYWINGNGNPMEKKRIPHEGIVVIEFPEGIVGKDMMVEITLDTKWTVTQWNPDLDPDQKVKSIYSFTAETEWNRIGKNPCDQNQLKDDEVDYRNLELIINPTLDAVESNLIQEGKEALKELEELDGTRPFGFDFDQVYIKEWREGFSRLNCVFWKTKVVLRNTGMVAAFIVIAKKLIEMKESDQVFFMSPLEESSCRIPLIQSNIKVHCSTDGMEKQDFYVGQWYDQQETETILIQPNATYSFWIETYSYPNQYNGTIRICQDTVDEIVLSSVEDTTIQRDVIQYFPWRGMTGVGMQSIVMTPSPFFVGMSVIDAEVSTEIEVKAKTSLVLTT